MIAMDVARRALRATRASVAAYVGLLALKTVALCVVSVAGAELSTWTLHAQRAVSEVSAANRWIALGFLNLAILLCLTGAWSFLSSLHRAAIIALAHHGSLKIALDAIRSDRGGAILKLAVVLACADCVVMVVGTILVNGVLHADRVPGTIIIWYVFAWLVSRRFIGTIMATVIVEGGTPAAVLRASTLALRAHRLEHVVSRAGLTLFAVVAAVLSRPQGQMFGIVALLLVEPIFVTIDGALEAAWYAELHPPVNAKTVADTFE